MAHKNEGYAVCLENTDYPASLEVRKLYAVIRDADAAKENLIRVIDESGEDYLYPLKFFRMLELPTEVQLALRKTS